MPPEWPMTLPSDRAASSTQISLESTVPWLKRWPTPEGPHDDLDEILPARPERRGLGSQRRHELAVDGAAFAEAEDVDADLLVGQEPRVPLGGLAIPLDGRQARVGPDEEVVVDLAAALAVEVLGAEVGRGLQLHVALGAGRLGHVGIVEAPGPVPGDAREQERVVVVLAADEVPIMVQPVRQADLVAGRAELDVLDDRLEEGLLVHLGLGLDQRLVDPLQDRVVAVGEGIVHRLLDRVRRIAARVVDVGDRVARGAGDPGLAGRVADVVVVGVVERAREERHQVVAPGAPSRGLRVPVPLERDLPRLADAREVRLVVERAVVVRRVEPAVEGVLVALHAVVVHHQRLGRDELAVGRDRLGRIEVLLPLLGPLDAERPGVLAVQHAHQDDEAGHRDAEPPRPVPSDHRAGQAVLDVQGDRRRSARGRAASSRSRGPTGRGPRSRRSARG